MNNVNPEGRDSPIAAHTLALDPSAIFASHFPTFIAILSNRMTREASSYYRSHYGVGIVEMRILYALAVHEELSAAELTRVTDLDKGAVSRSSRVLQRLELVTLTMTGRKERRVMVKLTAPGRALYQEILENAQQREQEIMSALSPEERIMLTGMLTRLFWKISETSLA